MGIAIAQAAANMGAKVKLVYGNVTIPLPQDKNIELFPAPSSEDMLMQVKQEFNRSDILIMAAAVADWRMKKVADHKLKKQADQATLELTLVKTKDILREVAKQKNPDQVVVGFAAETNNLLKNAEKKLREKGADMIVANDVSQNVFGSDKDKVTILRQNGTIEEWPEMSKKEIASKLLIYVNSFVQK